MRSFGPDAASRIHMLGHAFWRITMARVFFLSVLTLMSCPSLSFADEGFAGKWSNVDENTGGLTRLEISSKGKTWTIQAWGASGGPDEIDQGKVTLHLLHGDTLGDTRLKYGIASWDHKFKETH